MYLNLYTIPAIEGWNETNSAKSAVTGVVRVATKGDVAFVDPALTHELKSAEQEAGKQAAKIKESFDDLESTDDILKKYRKAGKLKKELLKEEEGTEKNKGWLSERHADIGKARVPVEKEWIKKKTELKESLGNNEDFYKDVLGFVDAQIAGDDRPGSSFDMSPVTSKHSASEEQKTAAENFVKGAIVNRLYDMMLNASDKIYKLRIQNGNTVGEKPSEKAAKIEQQMIEAYLEKEKNSENAEFRPDYGGENFKNKDETGNSNCYAYAVNDPSGHENKSPDPGDKSANVLFKPDAGEHVASLAVADGLKRTSEPVDKEGFYLVALAVNHEDYDYHWMRKDKDGTWSHKVGHKDPRQSDFGGNVIIDPSTANWGKYDEFVGYFHVPKDGIRVGYKARKDFISDIEKIKKNPEMVVGSSTQERMAITSAIRSIDENGKIDNSRVNSFQRFNSAKKPTEAALRKEKHDKTQLPVTPERLKEIVTELAKGNKETVKQITSMPEFKTYENLDREGNLKTLSPEILKKREGR